MLTKPFTLRNRLTTNKPYIQYRYWPEDQCDEHLTKFQETCEQLDIDYNQISSIYQQFTTNDLSDEQELVFKLLNSELIDYSLVQHDMTLQHTKNESSFGILNPILDFINKQSDVFVTVYMIISIIIILPVIILIASYGFETNLVFYLLIAGIINFIICVLLIYRREKFYRLIKQYAHYELMKPPIC